MKAVILTLGIALLAGAISTGCVVVPAGGWYAFDHGHSHGKGWRHRHHHPWRQPYYGYPHGR
jgi:hypothetical protein